MKNAFLSIVFFITMAFTVQAQTLLIPKAGITVSNFAFAKDPYLKKSATSFTGGLAFNLPIGKGAFSIQPEISFIQKNYSADDSTVLWMELTPDGGMTDYIVTINRERIKNLIEVPVLAKYTFGRKAFKSYLIIGPSVGYWFSGKQNIKRSTSNLSEEKEYKFDKDTDNRLDVGIQAGGGLMYQLGPGSLVLDARYGYGLTNYVKKSTDFTTSGHKSQSRTFAFTLGYAIVLDGR